MRSLERVNIRTNVRTYVLTYIRTGQTLYPLHNFVVRGDNKLLTYHGQISGEQHYINPQIQYSQCVPTKIAEKLYRTRTRETKRGSQKFVKHKTRGPIRLVVQHPISQIQK